MLPVSLFSDTSDYVTIVATGDRNANSKGTEVWMPEADSRRIEEKIVSKDPGWENREGALVSYKDQPAEIKSFLKLKTTRFLSFSTHEYSGIVEVKYKDAERRIDLYSPIQGVIRVDLSQIAPMKVDVLDNFVFYGLCLGGFFIGFLILILILSRQTSQRFSEPRSRTLDAWILLSSFTIYGLALAAYWPAQMSPDSINQWQQIVQGDYNDAHPILSTMFYKIAFSLYPFPQSAVILQIITFSGATWLFFRECLAWGASRRLIAIAAVLFPLFPPNFLIVTTLWKDVPFTACVIVMSALVALEVRHGLLMKWKSLLWLGVVGVIIVALRHNGIIISVLTFLVLACFAKTRASRMRIGGIIAIQIIALVLIKSALLSFLNVAPIKSQYRAINAMHVIGAMQTANYDWGPDERKLLETFLPEDEWRKSYNCETVVPLFWNPILRENWVLFGQSTSQMNSIALRAILKKPLVFISHQACVTGLIWRIGSRDKEWLSISPGEITEMPERAELGLESHSLLTPLKTFIDSMVQPAIQKSTIYNRPALFFVVGLIAIGVVTARTRSHVWLIAIPSLCNLMSLVLLMGAQDYRYVWPSVVMSLLMLFLAMGLAFGRSRLKEKSGLINAQ